VEGVDGVVVVEVIQVGLMILRLLIQGLGSVILQMEGRKRGGDLDSGLVLWEVLLRLIWQGIGVDNNKSLRRGLVASLVGVEVVGVLRQQALVAHQAQAGMRAQDSDQLVDDERKYTMTVKNNMSS